MDEQPNNTKRSNSKRKEFKMGQMSWLHHLVTAGDKKNLVKFLDQKGFKRPEFAANQFLKAQEEIEEDGMKKKEEELSIDEMNEAIKSTPEYKIGKNVGKWVSKYKDGEPTTADEHNEKWLNEKEGKS